MYVYMCMCMCVCVFVCVCTCMSYDTFNKLFVVMADHTAKRKVQWVSKTYMDVIVMTWA